MTNLTLEILFWTILISYLGLRFNQTWNSYKQQYQLGGENETSKTIHSSKKRSANIYYVNREEVLRETIKRECQD